MNYPSPLETIRLSRAEGLRSIERLERQIQRLSDLKVMGPPEISDIARETLEIVREKADTLRSVYKMDGSEEFEVRRYGAQGTIPEDILAREDADKYIENSIYQLHKEARHNITPEVEMDDIPGGKRLTVILHTIEPKE